MTYRVKGWDKFQHYKDRNPSWVKLHKNLLDDYEFHCLPVASRALAPMLWLLASEAKDPSSGIIEGSIEKLSFRLRLSVKEFEQAIKPLLDNGFIECYSDASAVLAPCYSDAMPEKEREEEKYSKEEEKEKDDFILPDWIPEILWDDFMKVRKKLKAANTTRAKNSLVNKLTDMSINGHDPIQAIDNSIRNSWKDVYEPKGNENGKSTNNGRPKSAHENFIIGARAFAAEE